MALLEAKELRKRYKRRQVVDGVGFEVDRGEVVGLLGPNGAGKTTSFRITIGLIDADGGHVSFLGQDITHMPMYLRARAGMGYLAQDSSVFKQLSVEDNLMAILETRSMSRKRRRLRQEDLLTQFGLKHARKTLANRISGGERRRLEIARCLITEPKLIMLDEPFAGIDPITVGEIQTIIRQLVDRHNIGILITDHSVREILNVTDRNIVIHQGKVIATGNRRQILGNEDVRRAYIGKNFDEDGQGDHRHDENGHEHGPGPGPDPQPASSVSYGEWSIPVSAPLNGNGAQGNRARVGETSEPQTKSVRWWAPWTWI